MPSPLGERLLRLRADRKWSQADLAERLEVAKAAVGHYENGVRYPQHDVLVRIAKILGVTVGKLYEETAGSAA